MDFDNLTLATLGLVASFPIRTNHSPRSRGLGCSVEGIALPIQITETLAIQHLRERERIVISGPLTWSQYSPSGRLPRLSGVPIDQPAGQRSVSIVKEVGRGAVWRAYEVKDCAEDTAQSMVLKLAGPTHSIHSEDGFYDIGEMQQAIRTEFDLVEDVLLDLQGTVIPRVYGLYAGAHGTEITWGMLMENGGSPVIVEELFLYQK